MGDPSLCSRGFPAGSIRSLVSSFSRGSFGRSGFSGGGGSVGGFRSGSGVHGGRIGSNGGGVGGGSGGVSRFSGRLGGGLAGGDGQSEGSGSRDGQQLTDVHGLTPEMESNGGIPRSSFGNAFVRSRASPHEIPGRRGGAGSGLNVRQEAAQGRIRCRRSAWRTGSLPSRGRTVAQGTGHRPGRSRLKSGPHCRAGGRPGQTG